MDAGMIGLRGLHFFSYSENANPGGCRIWEVRHPTVSRAVYPRLSIVDLPIRRELPPGTSRILRVV